MFFFGNLPQRTHSIIAQGHPMAQCSRLEPIPYSPLSPLLVEQGPSLDRDFDYRSDEDNIPGIDNLNVTGVAMSTSGVCGQQMTFNTVSALFKGDHSLP